MTLVVFMGVGGERQNPHTMSSIILTNLLIVQYSTVSTALCTVDLELLILYTETLHIEQILISPSL